LFNACFRIARELNVPIVLENVKGGQRWVGKAQANFGSYYLWGDIANVGGRIVRPSALKFGMPSVKAAGVLKRPHETRHVKNSGGSWFRVAHNTESGVGQNPVNDSKSDSRKAASARIAEIPFELAAHIARVFKP
jgi:hypothetical protein